MPIVEIRAAEGGDDAKLLVEDQTSIYCRVAAKQHFEVEIVERRPGFVCLIARGPQAEKLFADEPGGHRWQRVPPTERNGRVHTSTVTIAVLPESTPQEINLRESDLEWSTTRASGPGGQNVNKVETVAIVKHKPSGLTVRCQSERSQSRNKATALGILASKLKHSLECERHSETAADRKRQVGSGMRGDKRRTIRSQDGRVKDHLTGRVWDYRRYVVGDWS